MREAVESQILRTMDAIDDLEMKIRHLSYLLNNKKKYLKLLEKLHSKEETK